MTLQRIAIISTLVILTLPLTTSDINSALDFTSPDSSSPNGGGGSFIQEGSEEGNNQLVWEDSETLEDVRNDIMQVLEEKYGGKLVGKGGDNPPRPTPEWFRLCGGTSADCRNDPLGANANVEVSLLEDNNRQKLQIGTRFLYNDVGGKVKVAVLRPNGKVKTKYHKGAMGEDGRINLCGGEGGGGGRHMQDRDKHRCNI
ncbi:MAG: hypothetical protein ABEJ83_03595 [Candidatus Nanohaloarchaea archaeon]